MTTIRTLLYAAAALALAGPLSASPHHVVEAVRAPTPPAIDGDLADWSDANWIRVAQGAPHMSAYAALRWGLRYDGPSEPPGTALTAADASGRLAIRWDDDFLYLAADVTDNVHDVTGGTSVTWYLKDGVALFLDIPNDDDGGEWVPGDHAFVFVADPSYPEYGRWWRRGEPMGSAESAAPPETRMSVSLNREGYHIEAAIPMAVLTENTPAWRPPFAGRAAGLLLLVMDPDGGDDAACQLQYGGDDDNDSNWSTLVLVDERQEAPQDRDRGAGPVLTRLHFRVAPDRQEEFSKSFDTRLLPVLKRHGFTPVDGPLSVAADSVYARLFSVPDLDRFWGQWADVELDPEWISGRVDLATFASHGLRVGQIAPERGDHAATPRAIRGIMRVYSVPASDGVVLPAGAGVARDIESSTVPAGVGIRHGNWWNLGVPDGFSSPEIRDVVQGEDGGLWLATELGVSHFDGARITNYRVSGGSTEELVYDIDFSRDGDLWVARGLPVSTGQGGGISRLDGSGRRDYSVRDGLANNVSLAVTQDSRGRHWFGTFGGVTCVDGERASVYTTEHGLANNIVGDILESADGAMWFATAGGLTRFDGTRFTSYTSVDGLPDDDLETLMQDSSGRVWATARTGAAFFDGEAFHRFDTGDLRNVSTVAEDSFGSLWFGSYDDGLYKHDGDQLTSFGVEDGMLDQVVASILEDREGHIWVGTREALSRYDGDRMRTFTVADGLPSNRIGRLLEDRDGGIWLASSEGGLARHDGRRFVTFSTQDGLADDRVNTLLESADGTIWIGTLSGLAAFDGNAFATHTSDGVWRMSQDHTGRLWLSSQWGVTTYDGERLEPLTHSAIPTNLMMLDGGLTDADGNLWFTGSNQGQGGLYQFDGSEFHQFTMDGGFAVSPNAMLATEDEIWFGGRSGLARFDGQTFDTYTTRDGLTRDDIIKIARDGLGNLWIASYGGGVDVFDGTVFQNLHRPDGLPSDTANDLLVARDGAVWIATDNGVTRYRPGRLAPPIRVTEVAADRSYGATDEVSFSSSQELVAIEFRSTSLKGRANRIVYLYRLLGYEEEWQQTRETRVEYSGLPGGEYTFQVLAVDADLNRSEHPAEVRLEVHPPYAQLAWIMSTGLALILIAFQTGRVVRRDRRLSAQNRQLTLQRATERVRAEVLSMRSKDDFVKVLPVMWQEMTSLDVYPVRITIAFVEEAADRILNYDGIPNPKKRGVSWTGSDIIEADSDTAVHLWRSRISQRTDEYMARWRAGAPWSFPVSELGQIPLEETDLEVDHWERLDQGDHLVTIVPFEHGSLGLHSEAYSERHEQILQEFTEALSLGYLRLLEFERLEENSRRVNLDRATERVRAEVQAMASSDDFFRVLPVLWRELEDQGIELQMTSVAFVDEEAGEILDYSAVQNPRRHGVEVNPELMGSIDRIETGKLIEIDDDVAMMAWTSRADERTDDYMDRWREGHTWTFEIAREEMPGFFADVTMDRVVGHRPTVADFPRQENTRYVAAVPFAEGSLAIHTENPLEAFVPVVEKFADALSVGYVRFRDFQRLEEARAAAEAANEAKSAFLANMSHELRTPLNGILGYAQILGRDSDLSDNQRDGVDTIRRSGEHLLTLINDILDLSKIEAHKLELEPSDFDLRDFVETLSDPARMRAEQEGLSFSCRIAPELPAGVRGDERKLRQVLLNLLGNAVKFTDDGSVVLTVGRGSGDGSQVRFAVADSGPGIAADEFDKVFKPFEQLTEPGAVVQGTGLGLAISKELVELMGGELALESEPGRGSTFTVTLALPEAEGWVSPTRGQSRHPTGYTGKRRAIVVADDRPENRVVLLSMLTPLGFEVIEAADGEECLEQLSQTGADIVLVDLIMPVIDGFEVARRIRSSSDTAELPVIAVSASVYEQHREQSLAAGCSDFLAKPVDEQLLLEKLQRYLQLEWTYDEDTGPAAPERDLDGATPPPGELDTLVEAAKRGDIVTVRAEIDRVRSLSEGYAGFAERLSVMARSFDLKGIVELLGAAA